MGFGTGLNALLAYDFATQNQIKLRYTTIEAYPINDTLVEQLPYQSIINEERLFKQLHTLTWNENHILSNYFTFHKIKNKIEDVNIDQLLQVDCIFMMPLHLVHKPICGIFLYCKRCITY
ncbi:MAG: hypothetical protein LRY27_03320 [Chitinophagales bacterium]|nr:hypothetical protein [Chitinophagales bacterium]